MACKAFELTVCQHDDPPDSETGWASTDTTMDGDETLTVRARFGVIGDGDDCTGQLEWYYRWEGGSWVYFGVAKNVEPGSSNWYAVDFVPVGLGGTYDIRTVLTYDGYDYNAPSFEVVVAGVGTISTGAAAVSDLAETAGAMSLAQESDARALAQTAGACAGTATAESPANSHTAGAPALSMEGAAEGRTQTAGAPARSIVATARDRTQTAGGTPRSETARMLSTLAETAGTA